MVDARSHSEPHADVAGYLLGSLDDAEAEAFSSHLAGCEACRTEIDELADLPALLADVPDSCALPAGLEERTFRAVEASRSQVPTAPAQRAQPAGKILPIGVARRRSRKPLAFAVVAATAAACLVALIGLRSRSPAPLATVRLISADGGSAHGNAIIRATPAGLTIDMTVDGLAPAPAGKMYTCWLVANDDTLAHPDRVSVGSFTVRGNTVHAHWTTAANLTRFPHLGITVEPDNGNPSHQGPKVLTSL